jgi:hypothetical protein
MPVNDKAEQYKENEADWQMIRDVIAGAKAVRAGGDKYLPRLSDMSYGEYAAYSKRAQFFNATARTLNGLVGAIFRKEPEIILGEGAEGLRPRLDECTIDNQPFNVFARAITREVLSLGRVGAMVDAPASGGNPYFTHYNAESITNWRLTRFADNRIVPDQIILSEEVLQASPDGFGSVETMVYRELFLDGDGIYTQRIWVPVKNRDNTYSYVAREQFSPRISGLGTFNYEIPFVCFGPRSIGLPVQRSPILDIAELNILHFQRSAQLAHGQFYTATPTYWAVPPNNGELPEYRVGPSMVWLVDQANSCGILEYRGEGLKYLESACAQLEQQMASLGARLASTRRGEAGENLEVANLRNQGEASLLVELIESIENGLTELLKIWVRWHGRNPRDVKVKMNRNFNGTRLEYRTWLQLDRAHEKGDLDDETYYRVLFESDTLPANYSHEDVKALIDKAVENRAKKAAEIAANTPDAGSA